MYVFTKSNHWILTRKSTKGVQSSLPKTFTLRNTGSFYTQGNVYTHLYRFEFKLQAGFSTLFFEKKRNIIYQRKILQIFNIFIETNEHKY